MWLAEIRQPTHHRLLNPCRGDGTNDTSPIATANESLVFDHTYTNVPGGKLPLIAYIANKDGMVQEVVGELLTYDSHITIHAAPGESRVAILSVVVGVPPTGPGPEQVVEVNW